VQMYESHIDSHLWWLIPSNGDGHDRQRPTFPSFPKPGANRRILSDEQFKIWTMSLRVDKWLLGPGVADSISCVGHGLPFLGAGGRTLDYKRAYTQEAARLVGCELWTCRAA
jgi:hypothetical protein